MDLNSYLERIGIKEIKTPSLEFLAELQNRHMLSIPFENLDIPRCTRIELDVNKLYNKIIPTKRGGFCYELNGLFHWLLTSLGFEVDMLSSRVYNHQKKDLGQEFDHMCLIVHLDRDYLVDVGFGDSFRTPIEMPDGEAEDVGGHYGITQIAQDLFALQKKEGESWLMQYLFTTMPRQLDDYTGMCSFQQDDPNSHFRTRKVCTIATASGRITLSDNSLTLTEGKTKTKTEFKSTDEFYSLLKKYFGIEF